MFVETGKIIRIFFSNHIFKLHFFPRKCFVFILLFLFFFLPNFQAVFFLYIYVKRRPYWVGLPAYSLCRQAFFWGFSPKSGHTKGLWILSAILFSYNSNNNNYTSVVRYLVLDNMIFLQTKYLFFPLVILKMFVVMLKNKKINI